MSINKYVDVSATFCGDGTTSTQATFDGGVGAWNDFIAVIQGTPTYGALNDDDDVYIRSHDGTSDLSQVYSGTSTLECMDCSSPDSVIRFIFDNGDVWADGGQFTLEMATINDGIKLGQFTEWIGSHKGTDSTLRFYFSTYTSAIIIITLQNSLLLNAYIEERTHLSDITPAYLRVEGINVYGRVINCYWLVGSHYTSSHKCGLILRSSLYIVNLTMDITAVTGSGGVDKGIFGWPSTYANFYDVNGLEILGDGTDTSLFDAMSDSTTEINMPGNISNITTENGLLKIGIANEGSHTDLLWRGLSKSVSVSGINGNPFDFTRMHPTNKIEWRSGQNYPYLNAVLPDGLNTPWSYKISPFIGRVGSPLILLNTQKYYTETPATKKLTFEILSHEDLVEPTKNQWWVEIIYLDSSGNNKSMTSFTHTVDLLDESTASWYPLFGDKVIYGANSYDRYKIELSTPTPIKQNSFITAVMYTSIAFADTTKFLFVDPEFLVEDI